MIERDPRHQREPVADGGEDEAREQPHVQARNGQEMREVRVAQRRERIGIDARAVPGQDGRREPAGPARHPLLDRPRQVHAHREHRLGKSAPLAGAADHRRSRIADGADLVEPRELAEVEAAGLRRGGGGRHAGIGEDAPARQERVLRRVGLQRDARQGGCARRIAAVEDDVAERDAGAAAGGAVEAGDRALDIRHHRIGEHGGRDAVGPPGGETEAGDGQDEREDQDAGQVSGAQGGGEAEHRRNAKRREQPGPGLGGQREVDADPQAEQDRGPEGEVRPLCLELRPE